MMLKMTFGGGLLAALLPLVLYTTALLAVFFLRYHQHACPSFNTQAPSMLEGDAGCPPPKKGWRWFKGLFTVLISLGVISQTATISLRWISSNHFPVVGLFEALFFFSFCIAITVLYLSSRIKEVTQGIVMLTGLVALLLLPCSWISKPIIPLNPFLDTPLFFLHVLFSFTGYALFAAAAAIGGEYLIAGEDRVIPWMEHSLLLGFCLFTFCMIAGAAWAYLAWESYWMWNLKNLWSFSLWLFYALQIHHRFLSRDEVPLRRRATYSIIGFLLVLFTFLGIGLLMRGTHSL